MYTIYTTNNKKYYLISLYDKRPPNLIKNNSSKNY